MDTATERFIESQGMIGKDFPDAVVNAGAYAVAELLELAEAIDEDHDPKAAWRWLRASMTQAEALQWLTALAPV